MTDVSPSGNEGTYLPASDMLREREDSHGKQQGKLLAESGEGRREERTRSRPQTGGKSRNLTPRDEFHVLLLASSTWCIQQGFTPLAASDVRHVDPFLGFFALER